jgi:hypothetical protein
MNTCARVEITYVTTKVEEKLRLSVAVMLTGKVPAALGVPVTRPVVPNTSPGGRTLSLRENRISGLIPLVAIEAL